MNSGYPPSKKYFYIALTAFYALPNSPVSHKMLVESYLNKRVIDVLIRTIAVDVFKNSNNINEIIVVALGYTEEGIQIMENTGFVKKDGVCAPQVGEGDKSYPVYTLSLAF